LLRRAYKSGHKGGERVQSDHRAGILPLLRKRMEGKGRWWCAGFAGEFALEAFEPERPPLLELSQCRRREERGFQKAVDSSGSKCLLEYVKRACSAGVE
jgi:hypothetical protein